MSLTGFKKHEIEILVKNSIEKISKGYDITRDIVVMNSLTSKIDHVKPLENMDNDLNLLDYIKKGIERSFDKNMYSDEEEEKQQCVEPELKMLRREEDILIDKINNLRLEEGENIYNKNTEEEKFNFEFNNDKDSIRSLKSIFESLEDQIKREKEEMQHRPDHIQLKQPQTLTLLSTHPETNSNKHITDINKTDNDFADYLQDENKSVVYINTDSSGQPLKNFLEVNDLDVIEKFGKNLISQNIKEEKDYTYKNFRRKGNIEGKKINTKSVTFNKIIVEEIFVESYKKYNKMPRNSESKITKSLKLLCCFNLKFKFLKK